MARAAVSRNKPLSGGINRLSRSKMYHATGKWAKKNKTASNTAKPAATTVSKQIGGAKNGGTRTVAVSKDSKYYPAENIAPPLKSHKRAGVAKLKAGIVPGAVLINLAGRFKGQRVVFLKQLSSGLLLVTGPYKINGVPLRRVNQVYVAATSASVDVSKVDVSKIDDAYFVDSAKAKAARAFIGGVKKEKSTVPANKVNDQKAVDKAILDALKNNTDMKHYLAAKFSLRSGQFPHELKL